MFPRGPRILDGPRPLLVGPSYTIIGHPSNPYAMQSVEHTRPGLRHILGGTKRLPSSIPLVPSLWRLLLSIIRCVRISLPQPSIAFHVRGMLSEGKPQAGAEHALAIATWQWLWQIWHRRASTGGTGRPWAGEQIATLVSHNGML
jgi:hypothetical protein